MNPPVPTEADEARTLVAYLRLRGYFFHHSPNETGSSMEARRRAIRVKREGTSRGFPDYLVLTRRGPVFIELKRLRGSVVSPEQLEWIGALNGAGIEAHIARGAEEAINIIEGKVI
jgi:hypothetical protein